MIEQVGIATASELIGMGVTLMPKRYEVWFIHRNHEAPELSRRIAQHLEGGGRITNAFLDRLASEFLDGVPGGEYSQRYCDLDRSSDTLIALTGKLNETLGAFAGSAEHAAAALETPGLAASAVGATINAAIEKTRAALADAQSLNDDLARAAETIESMKTHLVDAHADGMTDLLTGLCNKRHFMQCLDLAISVARKNRSPLSIIIAEIDGMASINESWGRQTGDQIIRFAGRLIASTLENKSVAARLSGATFAVLLPDAIGADAVSVAEAMRIALSERAFKKRMTDEALGAVTLSAGVAEAIYGDARGDLIAASERALEEARNGGGNRVALGGVSPAA
ncbi:MAG: diguanylate cyclase [Parvularculaceae bacterium]